jgi:cytochrome P450
MLAQVYPPEAMLGECFSIMGAGHDTTTSTLCILLKHLSLHPEVQQKLYNEIMHSVQTREQNGDSGAPSFSELNAMKYLAAVCLPSGARASRSTADADLFYDVGYQREHSP